MSASEPVRTAKLDSQLSQSELRAARNLTKKWIAIGWMSFVAAFAIAWFVVPRPPAVAEPLDRLLLALQLTAGPAVVLLLILQGLWRVTDTLEAENPLLGKESYAWRINQRVMTNTIEQTLIFVPMFIALAIRIEPERVFVLPLLMGFWCGARLLFWIGYRLGPHLRAPGMDWTIATTIVTAFLLAASLF